MKSVSVVIPVYNERENIPRLYAQLLDTLPKLDREYEILFVDDGSRDGSLEELRKLASSDPHVKVVHFRRNYGQTAAMQAGLQMASCDVIITMDGDLQNDPSDIGMMLDKIDEGYDLVHGWRKKRQDTFINRRLPSMIANWLISKTTRFPIHDLGCTLKAIRREIAQDLELYGEMHRFIPILAYSRGARCVEVVTNHHPRQFGQTKYGISRTLRVVLDLLTVKFLLDFLASPMKLFGTVSLACTAVAALCGGLAVGLKVIAGMALSGNPLVFLGALALMTAVNFVGLGWLAELGTRLYFGHHGKQHYTVRELINFEANVAQVGPRPQARAA